MKKSDAVCAPRVGGGAANERYCRNSDRTKAAVHARVIRRRVRMPMYREMPRDMAILPPVSRYRRHEQIWPLDQPHGSASPKTRLPCGCPDGPNVSTKCAGSRRARVAPETL